MLEQFAWNVVRRVREKVKGEVRFIIKNGNIIFRIYGVNDIVFRYELLNAESVLNRGYSSEVCTQLIVQRYKSYLNHIFFNDYKW